MIQGAGTSKSKASGLVTVAFLKAKLDEGSDHLGIFMPLVLDGIARLQVNTFTTADIQEALARDHGLAMPQETVATLLKRATHKKYVERDVGLYWRNRPLPVPRPDLAAEKKKIAMDQNRLGEALRNHAARAGLSVVSTETALGMLLRFLEEEQIAMLLGSSPAIGEAAGATPRERAVVAEFIQDAIKDDPALRTVLRDILEGLVLYQAAFLPDLSTQTRTLQDLMVVFDSVLVRQAIGYEGEAMRTLGRETVDVLKASGAQCLVFDKTVHEIRRILSMYEVRLATEEGRRSLRPHPMTRHFLTQRYTPGDVRELAALLERDIHAAGFQIQQMPRRFWEYTASERALTRRLMDPRTKDELEPRVVHDVDCVAAVLTLRRGHRSATVEQCGAVFATSSPLVIRNTRLWYREDEHETGIEPIVHIRALSNLAWLKKPTLCADFKVRELVALCTAALRPKQETWTRFLRHLEALERSQRLTSDEATAIVVSAMSDRLLREVEEEDPSDIDAITLDEVVDRVKASYAAKAEERIQEVADRYESKVAELEARERVASARVAAVQRLAAEKERRRELLIDGRARAWAHRISGGVRLAVSVVVLGGGTALVFGHPFHAGWPGATIGFLIVVFVALESFGILRHVSEWHSWMEARLTRGLREWLRTYPKTY